MLTANDFSPLLWDVLDQAKGNPARLRAVLISLSRADLIKFYKEFRKAIRSLWDDFDANSRFSIEPGQTISEDTKEDIFAYVVSQGRGYFSEIVTHPERIRRDIEPDDVPFLGLPGEVFWDLYADEITLQ